jgi:hypothetical protein
MKCAPIANVPHFLEAGRHEVLHDVAEAALECRRIGCHNALHQLVGVATDEWCTAQCHLQAHQYRKGPLSIHLLVIDRAPTEGGRPQPRGSWRPSHL